MNIWYSIIFSAPVKARTEIKKAVLEGIKYYGATWKEGKAKTLLESLKDVLSGPFSYKLKSKNALAQKLSRDLASEREMTLVGFIPLVEYAKERGPAEHLDVRWEHKFGSPALLYAHKKLPLLIIAGPDIMFDDSMVGSIKNNQNIDKPRGVTG